MSFICRSGIQDEEDTYNDDFCILPTRKLITRRRHSFCSRSNNKDNTNPYSNRGLDKFEALLADLDGKRQKIYTQKGSQDISLVRFVYTNANHVKPIVVKIKHQNHQEKKDHVNVSTPPQQQQPVGGGQMVVPLAKPPVVVDFGHMRSKLCEWWRPWYCLPFFVVLILVFLVFFGRSFAILCTSIGWYLVPMINREAPKKVKKNMKKEYSRKFSEKMITSPTSVLNSGLMTPQPHRRSF